MSPETQKVLRAIADLAEYAQAHPTDAKGIQLRTQARNKAAIAWTQADLRRDPRGKLTTGPLIKSGPNRGRGRPDRRRGEWRYAGGRLYSAGSDERSAHSGWIKLVESLGHEVGCSHYGGVVSYYVWVPEVPPPAAP